MGNEYRKLLKSQFGKKNYADFVRSVKAGLSSSSIIHKGVYQEMYHKLSYLQPGTLVGQHRQLEDVILRVMRIGKLYSLAVIVYLLSVLLLLLYGTVPVFTGIGLSLVTLAFAVKTAEYLSNKFCYIDVRIIITYKTALERLIMEAEVQKNEMNRSEI